MFCLQQNDLEFDFDPNQEPDQEPDQETHQELELKSDQDLDKDQHSTEEKLFDLRIIILGSNKVTNNSF